MGAGVDAGGEEEEESESESDESDEEDDDLGSALGSDDEDDDAVATDAEEDGMEEGVDARPKEGQARAESVVLPHRVWAAPPHAAPQAKVPDGLLVHTQPGHG